MKNTACALFFLAFLGSSIYAQFVSPVPVVESEIRDNSSPKMRSIEMDRIKRDARKINTEKLGPASVNSFLEIKEDFEKIQMLQSNIVKSYTTGKEIQYSKIASFSAELNRSASRLKKNLFLTQNKDLKMSPGVEPEESEESLPKDVKYLIVGLDNAIGNFVDNPIFLSSKKIKIKEKEKAATDLEQVLKLSTALQLAAEKQIRPKN